MKSAIGQRSPMRGWEKLGVGGPGNPQVFLGFPIIRITPKRFTELDDGLGNLSLCQVNSPQIIVGNC